MQPRNPALHPALCPAEVTVRPALLGRPRQGMLCCALLCLRFNLQDKIGSMIPGIVLGSICAVGCAPARFPIYRASLLPPPRQPAPAPACFGDGQAWRSLLPCSLPPRSLPKPCSIPPCSLPSPLRSAHHLHPQLCPHAGLDLCALVPAPQARGSREAGRSGAVPQRRGWRGGRRPRQRPARLPAPLPQG